MDRRILVVDDEAPIRQLLTDAFGEAGYQVLTAPDGPAALELLSEQNVRVMIFDLKMPGMTGIELCRRVKERYPISCVYAMTAYISLFGLSDCLAAGFDDYFIKPVEMATLQRAVAQAFEKLDRWTKR